MVCLATAGGEMCIPVVKTPRSRRQQGEEQQETCHGPILRSWPLLSLHGHWLPLHDEGSNASSNSQGRNLAVSCRALP